MKAAGEEGKCEAREERNLMKAQQWRRDRAWTAREPIQALLHDSLSRYSLEEEEPFKTPNLRRALIAKYLYCR